MRWWRNWSRWSCWSWRNDRSWGRRGDRRDWDRWDDRRDWSRWGDRRDWSRWGDRRDWGRWDDRRDWGGRIADELILNFLVFNYDHAFFVFICGESWKRNKKGRAFAEGRFGPDLATHSLNALFN